MNFTHKYYDSSYSKKVNLVKKVDLFENECLQKFRSNQFSPGVSKEIVEAIAQIASKIESLRTKEDLVELNELIYEKTYLLEKIIFNDRTITFVEKANCKLCEVFNEMDVKITFGKLIIVKNYYFGKRGLNFLTKYFIFENYYHFFFLTRVFVQKILFKRKFSHTNQ